MKRLAIGIALAASLACTRGAPPNVVLQPESPLEVLGSEAGVSMAKVHLGPSETFRFQANPCQEVLVFVERGMVRASMNWIESGNAARFRAPTVLQAMSEAGAEIFVVAVLSADAPVLTVDWDKAPEGEFCAVDAEAVVISDPARSGPFVRADGRLSVMIYLDGDSALGLPVASLGTLDADATLGVPEHVHEDAAEVLWIRDGAGTMRVGDETRPVQPGTFVFVPRGTVHGFVPDGTRSLFAYQVYTPSGPEQRFR